MHTSFWKQGLVLNVIIFLLGVAFAPGITASREIAETNELNDDLVDITVGIGNHVHTVLLTPTQAMELESLIDQMKTRLDAATTWEKTSQIFDETVVVLYELGMLPDGMSVEVAQRLVKGAIRSPPIGVKAINRLSGRNLGIFDDDENRFCILAGRTVPIYFINFISSLMHIQYELFNPFLIFEGAFCFLYRLIMGIWSNFFPLKIGNSIILGHSFYGFGYFIVHPAHGWIHTFGLNGVKRWDGDLLGNYAIITDPGSSSRDTSYYGIMGFTGIRIRMDQGSDYYYLGTARHVKIKYYQPAGCDSK